MTADRDDELARLTRRLGEQPLDAPTRARLARARADALEAATTPRPVPAWLPATGLAAAAGVVLLLSSGARAPQTPPAVGADPAAAVFVYADEDAEIAADLEFFAWLESEGHAG